MVVLILGGARSGKSDYAQRLAGEMGKPVLYVATATVGDEEMAKRIARHRAARPAHWRTVEAPTGVGQMLAKVLGDGEVVLLDCLTLLVYNLLMELGETADADVLESRVTAELEELLTVCAAHRAALIMVSNEVGMGLVPPYPMGRVYRDVLGRANQWLAGRAEQVIFMVAGLPMVLKQG